MGSMLAPTGSCRASSMIFRSTSSPTATTFWSGVTETDSVKICSPFSRTISKGASSEFRVIVAISPNRIISVEPGVPIFMSLSSSTLPIAEGCAIRSRRPSNSADPAPTTWFSKEIFSEISSMERSSLVSRSSSISI